MLSVTPRDQEPQNDKITDVFRKPQLKMITPQNPNPVTCNPVIHAYSFDVRNSIPAVQQPRFYLDGGRRQEFPELRRLDSKFERAAKKILSTTYCPGDLNWGIISCHPRGFQRTKVLGT